jgi:hypothetical protein
MMDDSGLDLSHGQRRRATESMTTLQPRLRSPEARVEVRAEVGVEARVGDASMTLFASMLGSIRCPISKAYERGMTETCILIDSLSKLMWKRPWIIKFKETNKETWSKSIERMQLCLSQS